MNILKKLLNCYIVKLFIIILTIIFNILFAQTSQIHGVETILHRNIKWKPKLVINHNSKLIYYLNFDGAEYEDANTLLPYYYENISLNQNTTDANVTLTNLKFTAFSEEELKNIKFLDKLNSEITVKPIFSYSRKMPFLQISFIPIRKNPATNKIEKLISFTIEFTEIQTKIEKKTKSYTNESMLNSGKWLKIKIAQDGIYKLTYSELIDWGISKPENVSIFGYGGGMLPTMNNEFCYDDLIENAIWMENGSDGIFNEGDYILFYAKGPTQWKYDTLAGRFVHSLHLFSDFSYYYVTSDKGSGKKILTANSTTETATNNVSSFNDYAFHEKEITNFIQSGRLWVGEHFDILLSYPFNFSFPNLETTTPVKLTASVYARSSEISSFDIKANNQPPQNISVSSVVISGYTYAAGGSTTFSFTSPSDNISVDILYNKTTSSSEGWLNYILLNARRKLKMSGSQMPFRDVESAGTGNITNFSLSNTNENTKVWDVTDPANVKLIETSYSAGTLTFKLPTDTLREFVAFNGTSFYSPENIGEVANQNLHGLEQLDMIIVTHPDFLSYANQLAELHRNNDNLAVSVFTPGQIYNEFSSGAPDVAAIRNFVKMIYDKETNQDELIRYLLLFGDGSYDNKTNSANNTNYILTYQSEKSLSQTDSYVTDDFFGLLDNNEGAANGLIDIGIGRLPVKSTDEAKAAVDKIIQYSSPASMGDWRNMLCFIGDDEDGNQHMKQANDLAIQVDNSYPVFNIEKIFLDAYTQTSTPAGERYPDVNIAVNNRIKKGALIVNYIGHGSEVGFAHEHIVTVNDIMSWDNYDNLPIFVTATCEFSRFDDYARTSAGELVFLNPTGGGIALFTTTRLTYSGSNFALNQQFYNFVFEKDDNNNHYRLGDIMRLTKYNSGSGKRNFILLGDPALKLAIPEDSISTVSINQTSVSVYVDTLKALGKVTITGDIRDRSQGTKLTDFQGIVYPTVYDKPTTITTLCNNGGTPFIFKLQNNILFKGKASVTNGEYSFTFIVPKDIAYNFGFGKISYYADNSVSDANGYYKKIIIGGSSGDSISDNQGPLIDLYINDENFVFGGITDENPKFLAFVSDSNGINTVGSGIGHDITAILDEISDEVIVLNDYYESDLDSYQSGTIEYYLSDLSEGPHNLKLKVWDVCNNSSEAYIEFIVAKSSELVLDNIFNYPNPFTTKTTFYFNHNQPNTDLDVLISIFTVTGKLIKTIEAKIYTDGYNSSNLTQTHSFAYNNPLMWDGLDDFGDKVGRGVYIYRLRVRSNEKIVDKFEKLVILK